MKLEGFIQFVWFAAVYTSIYSGFIQFVIDLPEFTHR